MLAAENQPKRGLGDRHRQLRAPELGVHPHAEQVGGREGVQRLLDLGDDGDGVPVEGRLVGVALLVVGREVPGRELFAQVEHAVEGLAGVLGEAFPLGQFVDPQPFVQQEVEIAPGQQRGFHGGPGGSGRGHVDTERRSLRTASSRIRPRSSAVLNSTAISCAVRRPCGRSHR